MNINVGLLPHFYDAWNLDDGRVGAPKDAIPQFIAMHLDKTLDCLLYTSTRMFCTASSTP